MKKKKKKKKEKKEKKRGERVILRVLIISSVYSASTREIHFKRKDSCLFISSLTRLLRKN